MISEIIFWSFYRTSVLEKEDWKNVLDFLANAKQVMSSVQDVARKVADYANFRSKDNPSGMALCPCNPSTGSSYCFNCQPTS